MKVAERIANWIDALSHDEMRPGTADSNVNCIRPRTRVYGVVGAGAMHLNDAIAHHPGIRFLPMHHEQAASFAAEADARVSGKPGIVMVTSGPGVTNAMTGVACAFADSIPMIVIAGQVEARTLMDGSGIRQMGVSEVDGVALMTPITKYAACVTDLESIDYELGYALQMATSGRPGPVYLEFPLDVQGAELPWQHLWLPQSAPSRGFELDIPRFFKMLRAAQRPVLIVGNGVRLAGACEAVNRLIEEFQIPTLTSWNASDIVPNSHPCYIGRFGLFGDRAGNFAVQNADLLISIGCRLSIPQVGHHPELFAPQAKRIIIDVDPAEATKPYLRPDLAIIADVKDFLAALFDGIEFYRSDRRPAWKARCMQWKLSYPLMRPEYRETKDGVNAYVFMRELSAHLPADAIVVTDVGTAFVCSQQALQLNGRQRLFHSSGIAPMGYGLPAAIGACLAGNGRPIVCICGDGGIMFNLQELATIAHHKLPIAIFVLANGGYRTMQVTQGNYFGRESGASKTSGIKCPDFESLARTFEIDCGWIDDHHNLGEDIEWALKRGRPTLQQVHLAPDQQIRPRVQSRMENGAFVPVRLEDMWPHLPPEELAKNMEVAA
jgi:acetolactate synthase I/II/III large subunit